MYKDKIDNSIDYSRIITILEFVELCKAGVLTNNIGYGLYVNKHGHTTSLKIIPSEAKNDKYDKRFSFVYCVLK